MKPENLPSPLEAHALQIIGEHGLPMSTSAIVKSSRKSRKRVPLAGAYTMMSRLREKKMVVRLSDGRYQLSADGKKVVALLQGEA